MPRPPRRRIAAPGAVLLCTVAALAQTPARPTPAQAIEHALTPVREAAAGVTDAERARLRDVFDRAEATAAARVEAEHHRDLRGAAAADRQLVWLGRVLRARVEAMRAESAAAESARAVAATRLGNVERRAARDRASEELLAAERTDGVSTRALPAADVDASGPREVDAAVEDGAR